jgi:phage shock protein PspC (stress-responsive transcriptional regulator)
MKKTISINIGGFAFIIDEDAYLKLEQYINAIKSKFQNQDEQNEIIQDIEFRIAELFNKNLKATNREIVNIDDVTETTKKLGDPSTIAGEDSENRRESGGASFTSSEKKLFRNPDDKIISGVCSGLSAYLGLHDPIWIRILCVIIGLITGGSAIIAYIIFIVIIPEATTNSQKLQMKGQPVTLQNLEENLDNVRNSLNNSKFSETLHTIFNAIGRIIKYFVAFILLVIGFSVLTGLFFGALQSNLNWLHLGNDFSQMKNYLVDDANLFFTTLIAAFMVLGIPALAMIALGVRILTKISFFNSTAKLILIGLWILGLFLGGYVIKNWVSQVSYDGIYEEKITLKSNSKVLKISSNEDLSYELENNYITVNGQKMKEGKLVIPNTELNIKRSTTGEIYLLKLQKSNGKSDEIAHDLAKSIQVNMVIADSSLFIDRLFQVLGERPLFRNQRVRYILYIPVGKKIYLTNSAKNLIYDIKNKHNMFDDYMVNHTWEMKEDGLECIDCTDREIANGDADEVRVKSSRTSINIGGKEGDEFELKDGKLILKKNEEVIKVVDMD